MRQIRDATRIEACRTIIARRGTMASGRVLIAHPDPLARAYMRGLAERHLGSAGTLQADSFDALLAQLRDEPGVELVIVDSDLPGLGCEIGLRVLAAHHAGVRVAFLFNSLDPDKLEMLAASGTAALVPTQVPETYLVEILVGIFEGADHLPTSALHSALPIDRPSAHLARPDHELTTRQRDVLRLLSEGHPNREIADRLGIAEGTVKVHINAAFRLLGVHNRVSAARAFQEYFQTNEALAR